MARTGSKRAMAIAIMEVNKDLPMDQVLPLIVAGCDLPDVGKARGYYKGLIDMGLAPGEYVAARRGRPVGSKNKPKLTAVQAMLAAMGSQGRAAA